MRASLAIRRRFLTAGVVVAALAALLAGAAAQPLPGPATTAQPRRELRVGVVGLPAVIDPALAVDGPLALIARQVFDTLVAYREGGTDVEPALATRWTVSRDGLTWTFTLRDNVRFHDGTTLAASDVVASFDRQLRMEPERPPATWAATLRGVPGVVKQVRAADPRTVQIVLAQPYAPLLTVLAHPAFGIVRQIGPEGAPRLVGTGQYRVGDVSGERIVLTATLGHWAGSPRTDRLVFVDVADDDQAEAALDSRNLDIWFPAAPPRRTEGALSIPGLRVGYLAFQTEREPFTRKKVRQAFAAALDPAVLGAVVGRAAVPLQSFLPPGVWGRREGSPILGGSREAAGKLLAEGGWVRGAAPVLLAPGDSGPVDMPRLAETIQKLLAEVEVSLVVRVETEVAARTARAAGEHDLTLAEAPVTAGDPHLFLYPLSTSEGATRGPRTLNYSFYKNARLDDVLIRASQLSFRPERLKLYRRAQALLADELPWIPLYVCLEWALVNPEVQGLRLHPTGLHRLAPVSVPAPPAGPGTAPAPIAP